jgi:hypothetical protein
MKRTLFALVVSLALATSAYSGENGMPAEAAPSRLEKATFTFAGGCFWCMEPPSRSWRGWLR